jgi:hypothetical protein
LKKYKIVKNGNLGFIDHVICYKFNKKIKMKILALKINTFNNSIQKKFLTITFQNHIFYRSMMSGRSFQVARAAYNCFLALSNPNTLDKIKKDDSSPLVKEAVLVSLDNNRGVLQHKTAFFKHLSTQRFPGEHVYDAFADATGAFQVKCYPNQLTDFRSLDEVGTLQEYLSKFNLDIPWIIPTHDALESNFPNQKQPRVDFWVGIDRAMGLEFKGVYQDGKAGMDIVRHTLRGSIGLLSYNGVGENIQVTSKPITIYDIIDSDYHKIEMIRQTLIINSGSNVINYFEDSLKSCQSLCESMNKKSFQEVKLLHDQLQQILWNDFQANPAFQRSVSFIFLKDIINSPSSSNEETFSRIFSSHLTDKMYDLNKRQDFNDIFKVMLMAGKEIDPQFIKKLEYLHNNGVTLHSKVLIVIADLIKHGIT